MWHVGDFQDQWAYSNGQACNRFSKVLKFDPHFVYLNVKNIWMTTILVEFSIQLSKHLFHEWLLDKNEVENVVKEQKQGQFWVQNQAMLSRLSWFFKSIKGSWFNSSREVHMLSSCLPGVIFIFSSPTLFHLFSYINAHCELRVFVLDSWGTCII